MRRSWVRLPSAPPAYAPAWRNNPPILVEVRVAAEQIPNHGAAEYQLRQKDGEDGGRRRGVVGGTRGNEEQAQVQARLQPCFGFVLLRVSCPGSEALCEYEAGIENWLKSHNKMGYLHSTLQHTRNGRRRIGATSQRIPRWRHRPGSSEWTK